MNKIFRIGTVALAVVVLLTACGKGDKNDKKDQQTATTTGAVINYEDYITPVVDRKVVDCISADQINGLLEEYGYSYRIALQDGYTDSMAMYRSEDGLHTITLSLENMARESFDAIAANPALGWVALTELGEAVYWNGDQSELIAYQNGYAFSMAVQNMPNAVMVDMAEIVLDRLSVGSFLTEMG